MSESFDRAMALLEVPDVRKTRAATVVANNPLLGHASTHVIQTACSEDGFTVFLQVVSKENVIQLVLPDRVCRTLLRQMRSAGARPKRKPTKEEIERKKIRDARALLKAHREKKNGGVL